MEKKITKREVINAMLKDEYIKANTTFADYLAHELELLDKKSSNRKPTKAQEANEVLKDVIMDILADGAPKTVTEILATKRFEDGTSNQKITALLTQLVKAGRVAKETDKKKVTRFTAVADTNEDAEE